MTLESEQITFDLVEQLIAGRWYDKRFAPGDPRGQRRWATRNDQGHIIEVNWEGESDLMVTDDWLAHLEAFTELEFVHLDYNPELSGDGLRSLCNLEHITGINLASTAVSDSALAHLGGLLALEWLRLNDTEVGDAGLSHLTGLSRLRGIELFRTPVSDTGLLYLESLAALEHLNLSTLNVTEEGIQRIKAHLPNCEILSRWD